MFHHCHWLCGGATDYYAQSGQRRLTNRGETLRSDITNHNENLDNINKQS